MKLAVLVANRGFFPSSVIASAREEMKKAIEKAGAEVLMLPENATRYGAVETYQEGVVFNKFLKEHAGEFDGVVICLPNFGDENGIIAAIKGIDLPILLQAYPDEIGKMDFSSRRDAFCGKLGLGSVFKQMGVKYTSGLPFVMHPLSDAFNKEITKFIGVCRVVKGLKNLRIGVLGARTTAFKSVRYDEIAMAKHGIDTETLDLSQLMEYYNQVEDGDSEVKVWKEKLKAAASYDKVPAYALNNLAKLAITFEKIIKDFGLTAVAVRCWSELQHLLKITPCAVMGIFNDSGLPVICETDASNAILMAALGYASNSATGCLDINNNYGTEENKCIIFHCGPLPRSLMREKGDIQEHKMFTKTQGENCSWGVNVAKIKPGDITIAGCRTEDGEIQYFSFNAKVTEETVDEGFFGAYGVLETENLQSKLASMLENGFRHHVLITSGHHYEIVKEALNKYLGYKEIKL